MRNILVLLGLLLTAISTAQIPVTDVATNASIGIANNQLININMQLKAVNNNLMRLINLMEKNNKYTSKSKDILKEELEAKKKAPAYVTKSIEVRTTIDLKSKILEAYRTSKQNIQQWKYLNRKETQKYIYFATIAILETKNLFKQCHEILKTKAIILPEERLKKINTINSKLEAILDSLIVYNNKLSQANAYRKARRTLITINKN